MAYRAPKGISNHPAVEECTNQGDTDYRHDVLLKKGWAFTSGRMAGCRSGFFNSVGEFRDAEPTPVAGQP